MTPANIVGMAALKGLDVIALTDHNTCRNVEPMEQFALRHDILFIPGMELTTEEEVHVVCLFPTVSRALEFDAYVYTKLNKFPNVIELFGRQEIYDERDKKIGEEPNLLIQSTQIPFTEVYSLVHYYGGIMIPAHVDRNSHSLIYNMGFVPEGSQFHCVEFKQYETVAAMRVQHPYFTQCNIIFNSDAHYLGDISEPIHYISVEDRTPAAVLEALLFTKK